MFTEVTVSKHHYSGKYGPGSTFADDLILAVDGDSASPEGAPEGVGAGFPQTHAVVYGRQHT